MTNFMYGEMQLHKAKCHTKQNNVQGVSVGLYKEWFDNRSKWPLLILQLHVLIYQLLRLSLDSLSLAKATWHQDLHLKTAASSLGVSAPSDTDVQSDQLSLCHPWTSPVHLLYLCLLSRPSSWAQSVLPALCSPFLWRWGWRLDCRVALVCFQHVPALTALPLGRYQHMWPSLHIGSVCRYQAPTLTFHNQCPEHVTVQDCRTWTAAEAGWTLWPNENQRTTQSSWTFLSCCFLCKICPRLLSCPCC